eukprot:995403-Amphidinium_carterae.1
MVDTMAYEAQRLEISTVKTIDKIHLSHTQQKNTKTVDVISAAVCHIYVYDCDAHHYNDMNVAIP